MECPGQDVDSGILFEVWGGSFPGWKEEYCNESSHHREGGELVPSTQEGPSLKSS